VADDESVVLALKEADEAEELLAELERQSLEEAPGSRPSPAQVAEQRELVRFARGRVEVARRRAEDAREDARLTALHAVGARVGQLAAAVSAPSAEQVAGVRQIAELAAAIKARAAGHDAEVRNLYDEAAGLHGDPKHDPVKRTGQAGEWVPHQAPQGIRYGRVEVTIVGGAVDQALAAAVNGDVDGALKLLTPVRDHTPPAPTAYIGDVIGQFPVTAIHGRPGGSVMQGVRDGRFAILSPDEVEAWKARHGIQ
jgi:hypothetical protein